MCTQSVNHQVSINMPPPSPPTQLVPYLQEVHAADGGTIGGCEVQWGVSPAIRLIHLLVSHGRRQQAQQLYGVTHTAVNRKAVYSQVPHGCCQQAQQLTAHLKYRSPNTKTNRSEGV